jgi:hypothetical protein
MKIKAISKSETAMLTIRILVVVRMRTFKRTMWITSMLPSNAPTNISPLIVVSEALTMGSTLGAKKG